MREVIQDVNRQIRRQLTPEQQKEFEELLKHPPHKSIPPTRRQTLRP